MPASGGTCTAGSLNFRGWSWRGDIGILGY
jgi:hypothetical protein